MTTSTRPRFLRTIIKRLDVQPVMAGICAGFEGGKWRAEQLAEFVMDNILEFALKESEFKSVEGSSARKALREAAKTIYTSEKYQRRGEVGEILLHVIIREEFGSEVLINKVYFKDTSNDTVKGFDAVHIVESPTGLELWLGEVKLYNDLDRAIRDVIAELKAHTEIDYLRAEFAAICRKIDDDNKHAEAIKALLDTNNSMDNIFERICIPVLLTYDCDVLAKHSKSDATYDAEIIQRFNENYEKFIKKELPANIDVVLILFPLNTKDVMIRHFDDKLKGLMR